MGRALLVASHGSSTVARHLAAADWWVQELAVDEVERLPRGEDVDLVVCPLHLAGGEDGAALLARLRRTFPQARAFLTAEALAEGEAERLAEAACDVGVIRVPASARTVALAVAAAS